MAHNKKKITLLVLTSLSILVTASTITPGNKYKNLKVLPQDITEKQLDSMMHSYNRALNVSCDFCHLPKKDIFSITTTGKTDFSLDNEMKENARRMMRLTININKTYFYFDSIVKPEYLNVIHCNTCHRGNPIPLMNTRQMRLFLFAGAEIKPTGTGRIYTIKISSTDANGNVSTKTVRVTVPVTSPGSKGGDHNPSFTTTVNNSNEDFTGKLSVRVSSNPASYYFNLVVKSSSSEPVAIRVLDLSGRPVKQIKAIKGKSARFGEDLLPGTYLVEVR